MHRWARVTMHQRGWHNHGKDFWINESNVSFIIELDDCCTIGFASSEDDVFTVSESAEEIFLAWDNWQAIQEGSD